MQVCRLALSRVEFLTERRNKITVRAFSLRINPFTLNVLLWQVQEAVWASGRSTAPHLVTRVRFRTTASSIKVRSETNCHSLQCPMDIHTHSHPFTHSPVHEKAFLKQLRAAAREQEERSDGGTASPSAPGGGGAVVAAASANKPVQFRRSSAVIQVRMSVIISPTETGVIQA